MASMKIGGDYMRLIDADALDWERIEHEHGARHEAVVDCEQMVETAPTIDPVRHGRWESFEDVFMETCYECSECGLEFYLADGGTPKENKYHYCPNCGASMDR